MRLFLVLILLKITVTNAFFCYRYNPRVPCTAESRVSFWFYTRRLKQPRKFQIGESIPLEANKELKIIIHGFLADHDAYPNAVLRKQYFRRDEYNIISLDWSSGSRFCYIRATSNTKYVGECTAEMLKYIYSLNVPGVVPKNTHVIGFSLGAHIAGILGKKYTKMTGTKLKRITGLDPAGPGYSHLSVLSLQKSDAQFVDVIHTDCNGMFGNVLAMGVVDFYVNNCHRQPGCWWLDIKCDHFRAVDLFAESINTRTGFYGKPCRPRRSRLLALIEPPWSCKPTEEDKRVRLGEFIDFKSSPGSYHVITNGNFPFAQGKD